MTDLRGPGGTGRRRVRPKAAPEDSPEGVVAAARLAVLSTGFAAASVTTFLVPGGTEASGNLPPFAVLFAFCALGTLGLSRKKRGTGFFVVQSLADAAAVTSVVAATGGTTSPFVLLYPLTASAAVLVLPARHASWCAAAGAAMYGALLWSSEPSDATAVILRAACLGGALLLTCRTARGLAESARRAVASKKQSLEALARSAERHRLLVDYFPDPIVVCTPGGVVTGMNAAAAARFRRSDGDVVGSHVDELAASAGTGYRYRRPDEAGFGEERGGAPGSLAGAERRIAAGAGTGAVLVVFRAEGERGPAGRVPPSIVAALDSVSSPPDEETDDSTPLVGVSPAMKEVRELVRRAAACDATILVTGESGTGKEVVARAVHSSGPRASGPFVPVNCGAIPEALVEGELFGHKKGAFTGAVADARGLCREAHGGTLFLDEVGDLPPPAQVKLLRVLQERVVRPVGGTTDVPLDVRFIAATNRDLAALVASGEFREDLYYRLGVVPVHVPPLRERPSDIPHLVRVLLTRHSARGGLPAVCTPEAMEVLLSHDYPGNVRELENVLERAVVLGGPVITPDFLPRFGEKAGPGRGGPASRPETRVETWPVDLGRILAETERHYLEAALAAAGGVKTDAAALLGITFRSFRYRLARVTSDVGGVTERVTPDAGGPRPDP